MENYCKHCKSRSFKNWEEGYEEYCKIDKEVFNSNSCKYRVADEGYI